MERVENKSSALINSYLVGDRGPSDLTRLGILSAAELFRNGEIDAIVITVEPHLAEGIENRVKSLLREQNIPDEKLIVAPVAETTIGELTKLREVAQENDWGEVISICNRAHKPRVRRTAKVLFKDTDIAVKVLSAGEVLKNVNSKRYEKIVKGSGCWPEQNSLLIQETAFWFVSVFGVAPKLEMYVTEKLANYLPDKIALQKKAFGILGGKKEKKAEEPSTSNSESVADTDDRNS